METLSIEIQAGDDGGPAPGRSRAPSAQGRTLRALLIGLLFVGIAAGASAQGPASEARPREVRIGIVVDGPWSGNALLRELTVREVELLTAGEFDVSFPPEAFLIGDWNLAAAQRNLRQLLEDPEVDLVVTWGLLSSHVVCCLGDIPKPVVAPVIIDLKIQDLPYLSGRSGKKNLSYVELPDTLADDLGVFRSVVSFERVAILVNSALLEAVPELFDRTAAVLSGAGFEFQYVGVGADAASGLEALPEDADAVFVWPQFQLSRTEFQRLVDGLNERALPTFSGIGGADLEAGMLASSVAEDFFPRLARRVAINVQRILLGEEAGEIPIAFNVPRRLVINMETARRIGVSPTWTSLLEAELLHPVESGLPVRDLPSVMDEAMRLNLEVVARERGVEASAENVRQAQAALRPQVTASASATQVDSDRARAGGGTVAERSWTGSLVVDQVVYSDARAGNVEVQKRVQEGAEWDLESLRLDLALDAAVAYLDLLRAETLVEVQRNNLQLTRSNLELAETRRAIGSAASGEVYRWESQIAADRQALIDAQARRQVAAIAVNRLLHRPLEEEFAARPVSLEDRGMILSEARFEGFTETPARFGVFREFMVGEGLAAAPELRILQANIAAQERLLKTAERASWAPEVSLRGIFDDVLARDGLGSDPPPGIEDQSWSISLLGSLPLFTGGERRAARVQRQEELRQLRFEYESAVEKLEERIRSQVLLTRSAFASVELSQQGAQAARRNLDLVADAYARGAVSILDLLDAQNAALNADLQAANAVYDFFIELMRAQRLTSRYDILMSPEERDSWLLRLETFFRLRGVPAWTPAPGETDAGRS